MQVVSNKSCKGLVLPVLYTHTHAHAHLHVCVCVSVSILQVTAQGTYKWRFFFFISSVSPTWFFATHCFSVAAYEITSLRLDISYDNLASGLDFLLASSFL